MSQRKKKANRQRREEEEEVPGISNWSELCPDLLRCVFKRLSFISFNRANLVCSSWRSASRSCIPKPNEIPWLIIFPRGGDDDDHNNNNNNNSCVLVSPEGKENVYKTRDLGVELVRSSCLATYGNWLLMMNDLNNNLLILNPLTGERIYLPKMGDLPKNSSRYLKACFWIDNRTKDYLVFMMKFQSTMFIKKGVKKWHAFLQLERQYQKIVYVHKERKLYLYAHESRIKILDFSGVNPRNYGSGYYCGMRTNYYPIWKINEDIAITVSGDVLIVTLKEWCKTWHFRIYKANHVKHELEEIDSLGDEALILDMGVTVVAKDIPGIKRNSIYFSGIGHDRDDPDNIFVFDLTTQEMERLPKCVFSSIRNFSHALWFFPGFSG